MSRMPLSQMDDGEPRMVLRLITTPSASRREIPQLCAATKMLWDTVTFFAVTSTLVVTR